jgi:methyl-accepting chemotaxis protein
MKVSTKIFLLVAVAVTLFILSFGINLFFSQKSSQYHDFQNQIKDFENHLLATIIHEKDFARHPNEENARKVFEGNDQSVQMLRGIIDQRIMGGNEDLNILSGLLGEYRNAFTQMAKNNEKLNELKKEVSLLFDELHARSAKAAGQVDVLIGMAYIDGVEVNPGFNSFAGTNKNVVAWAIEAILAVNRDLLLDNNDDLFEARFQQAIEALKKEEKNIVSLAENLKDNELISFSKHVQATVKPLEGAVIKIREIWLANQSLTQQLDDVRGKIIQKDTEISAFSKNLLAAAQKNIFSWNLITFLIALTVLAVFGFYFGRSIIAPVVRTVERLKDIVEGEGDLTARLEADGKDEISDLARWFNLFVENLQKIIRDTAGSVQTLNEASSELKDLSIRLAAGSEQMSAQAENVAGATEEVSVSINAMASAAEEMSVNAQSVSTTAEQMSYNMNSIASSIEEMSGAIREVSGNAQKGSDIAGMAMKMSESATNTMNTLGGAAREIGEVTSVIKRIAEQTNLLALNATIEAASAGDAGRGFAVVANEIKELANQSARAAEDITRRIQGVQSNTDQAVRSIADISRIIGSINESSGIITRSVEQQTATAREISTNVQQANAGVNNIAASVAEIAKGANDMAKSAGEAAKGVNEVSLNIQGVSKAVNDSNSVAQQVSGSAEGLTGVSAQIQNMIGKFKV